MRRKYINVKVVACYIFFVLTSLIALYTYAVDSRLKEMMTVLISVVAAIAVFYQTKKSTDTARAEFVLNLQQDFTDSEKFSELFEMCWLNYNEEVDNEQLLEYLNRNKENLLNYLTFFESVYLMKKQGVITIELLDELFGRRFFIVVNNLTVQEFDLAKNSNYYSNIFYLYKDWSEYRIKSLKKSELECGKKKLLIDFEESSKRNRPLDKCEEYKEIVR